MYDGINIDDKLVLDVERKLGIEFRDKEKLYTILLHNIYLNEKGDMDTIKEKNYLREMGKSLFNLIKVEYIFKYVTTDFKTLEFIDKGTKLDDIASKIGDELNLDNYIRFNKNKKLDINIKPDTILYQLLALAYLENGYEVTKKSIIRNIDREVDYFIKNPTYDCKTIISEWSSNNKIKSSYVVINEYGPDNERSFEVKLKILNRESIGKGKSKKEAEEDAAYNYCKTYFLKQEIKKYTLDMEFKKYKYNAGELPLKREKELENIKRIEISDIWLLNQCFVHNSYLFENRDSTYENYDNIAYLGTYVRAFISDVYIYKNRDGLEEKFGSSTNKVRGIIMGRDMSVSIFDKTGLSKYVLIGEAAQNSTGIVDSIANSVIRAILGGILLSNGNLNSNFIKMYEQSIEEYLLNIGLENAKNIDAISRLQEVLAIFNWETVYKKKILKQSHEKSKNEIIAKLYIKIDNKEEYIGECKNNSYKLAKKEIANQVLSEIEDCIKASLLDNAQYSYKTNIINIETLIKEKSIEKFEEIVKKMPGLYKEISNIAPSVQKQILEINPNAIRYIKSLNKELQLEVVNQNGNLIRYINNPSLTVQLKAVNQNWRSIQYIENPNLEVQLEAVKQNISAIEYIDEPLPEVNSFIDEKHSEKENNVDNVNIFEDTKDLRKVALSMENNQSVFEKDYSNLLNDSNLSPFIILDWKEPFSQQLIYLAKHINIKNMYIAAGFMYKSGFILLEQIIEMIYQNSGEIEFIIGSLQKYNEIKNSDEEEVIIGMDKNTANYLNFLIKEKDVKVKTFEDCFYHGKFFMLEGEKKSCFVVGSSNVSNSAFNLNRELNLLYVLENNTDSFNYFKKWYYDMSKESVDIYELDERYFNNMEVGYISNYSISRVENNKFIDEINDLTDEELKFRLNLWMDRKPDSIYKDLGIESLTDYYLFEYSKYNLLVLESFEPKNSFYCFRNENVEELLYKLKGLTKTEIFELSDMYKRGYHIEDRDKLESNVNLYFVKKYKKV